MFQIKVAGVVVEIHNRYRYVRWLCRDYIVTGETPDFTVKADRRELEEEWRKTPDLWFKKWSMRPYCEGNCLYRKICLNMVDYGGFLMHAAVIEVEGEAIAFAAKSGVGKSTHVRLWQERYGDEVRVVNGDKPICRSFDGRLHVCGTPWNGKEQMGSNTIVPLKALCFLEQAEENSLERLTPGEAMTRLFHQVLLPREPERMDRFLALLEELLQKTPCWVLHCNMTQEAAETARRGLLGGE